MLCVAVSCAAADAKLPVRHAPHSASFDNDRLRAAGVTPFSPPLLDNARFAFTAPGRGASTARLDTVERAFRFTPSGQPNSRKAVTVAVNSARVAPSTDASRVAAETAAAPSAYNVGLAVGWRGFGVNGGYSRLEAPVSSLGPNHREAVDVGLSYHGRNWKTALQATAETGSPLSMSPLERRYSVDFGGAYALGSRLSVNGGVRYKLAPVSPGLLDVDRPDQSVYLGTAFSF